MSTTRWIIETECEHGEMVTHEFFHGPCGPEHHVCQNPDRCPGGSRLVVDPDNLPPERVERAAKAMYEALDLDPDDDPWESVLIYQKQLAADVRMAAAQTITAFLSDPEPGDQT